MHVNAVRLSLVLFGVTSSLLWVAVGRAQSTARPSAFCHVTDGQFTACPGGGSEWSDIPVQSFPQTESFVYASQADLDPAAGSLTSPVDTFVLMYDECSRRTPLGGDEYFRVAFKTVETEDGAEKLEHYVIHIFADGTIAFFEDGVLQPPGRAPVVDGMRGKVGFGRSPNCSFDHVVAEFEVPLSVTGHSYSPDPLFWGASVPPPPLDCPASLGGFGALQNSCAPPPECPNGGVEVPVLVNVLAGVDGGVAVSDAAVQDMVRDANFTLDDAGMCLTVALIDRDVPDLGDNDGTLDLVETNRLEDACINEMSFRFGTDVGYKVFLTNRLPDGVSDGWSSFLAPSGAIQPCVFLLVTTPHPPGLVLAHEVGHTAGLEHIEVLNNLMHPSPLGFGRGLTAAQQAVILAAALRRGGNSEHAAWTDATGDVGQGYIDLRSGSLFARSQAGDLEISLRLAESLPADRPVNVKIEALFDSDNNQATGATVGSRRGIDKILAILLNGRFPFTDGGGTTTATLFDVASGTSTPLAFGVVERARLVRDFVNATLDSGGVVFQTVPFGLLGASTLAIPMTIRTSDLDTGSADEVSFVFSLSHTPEPTGARAIRPGFDSAALPRGFNGTSGPIPIGFSLNFFGRSFTSLFVNNHGNVTLDVSLENFVLVPLRDVSRAIIAPFYADVDTRVGGLVTYGSGTVGNRAAFGATWNGVQCFGDNPAFNFFQMVLIDRSDVGAGDFDIEFNYDQIHWDQAHFPTGPEDCLGFFVARAGFSNGTEEPGTFFELPGSNIAGAFLDTSVRTGLIHGSLDAAQIGRYVLRIRNGVTDAGDQDDVADDLDNCPRVDNNDQRDRNFNGIGDACERPGLLNSTAAFMQAGFDGSTFVEPRSLLVAEEPGLLEQLTRIATFRLDAGLTDSARITATNLVASLVALNIVPPGDAGALVDAVIGDVTQPVRGDIDADGDVDTNDIASLLLDRNRLVHESTCGLKCDLDNDGRITVIDARMMVPLCTRPRCAAQ